MIISKKTKIITLFIVVFCSIALIIPKIYADNKAEELQLKIALNEGMTEYSNNQILNTNGLKNHLGKKPNELKNSFLNVNLKLTDFGDDEYKLVEGQGVIKVGNETFPFTISEQPLPYYVLNDGSIFTSGGITGTMKTNSGNSIFVLGLDMHPSQDKLFASTFIGELSENEGLGILRFGSPIQTKEIYETILEIKNQRSNGGEADE